MTNYTKYPIHAFRKNYCIIRFVRGDYSLCYLSDKTKKYLLESAYLDSAYKVDYRAMDNRTYSFSVEEFKNWLSTGNLKDEFLYDIKSAETTNKICPVCGRQMVIRTVRGTKNIGNRFYGCSGFPNCKYTEPIE